MRFRTAVVSSVLSLHFLGLIIAAGTETTRDTAGLTCADGQKIKITLRSTYRLPMASGTAQVERRGGTTEIEVELESMEPASLFGGDYNTYVLWVVPPQGAAQNLAELVLDGSHSKASGSTSASTFALLVTAEPHFLVNTPSSFVVLENEPQSPELTVQYRVLEGLYNFERSTLEDTKEAKGHVHTEVRQAFTAVRLAQRAGASRLATREFIEAQQALTELTNLWHQQREWSEVRLQARKTVRLAVTAQQLAINRALR